MAKKITIDIEVNGKMQKATVSADKLHKAMDGVAEGTDKATKSQQSQDRALKGAAKASSNSTKNFSKMAQGITGGLVPAYATLAANLFAVSAAFEFLKRSAQLKQLEDAQVSFAATTGVAMESVTNSLRAASQGMLGFREAAQATTVGLAKGFSPAQLEELADGALRASAALGRDFADAFDRLVRGVSKAEPELLDELGITLRLEEATRRYAQALGLNADELTNAQRSQAVLLETQRQLDEIFTNQGTTNAFVQLSKAFEDLVKNLTQTVLPVFEGFAGIVSRNVEAALAIFTLFAVGVFKAAFPMEELNKNITKFGDNAKQRFSDAKAEITEFRKQAKAAAVTVQGQRQAGREGTQAGARAAIAQGARSKLLQQVAEKGYENLAKVDQVNLKRFLKQAELNVDASGKVIKGVFKGVEVSIIKDIGNAITQADTKMFSLATTAKNVATRISLAFKVTFAGIRAAAAATTTAVIQGFQKMGKVVTTVLRIVSFVGIFAILKDMAFGLLQNLNNIFGAFASGIDFVTGKIADITGLEGFRTSVREAFDTSPLGKHTQALEQMTKEYRFLKSQADETKNAIDSFAQDLFRITGGLEQAQKRADAAAAAGDYFASIGAAAEKEKIRLNALASLPYEQIINDIEKVLKSEGGRQGTGLALGTELMEQFLPQLRQLGEISPEIAEALKLPTDQLVDRLREIQAESGSTVATLTGFNDSLNGLQAALDEGTARGLQNAFNATNKEFEATMSNLREGSGLAIQTSKKFNDVFKKIGMSKDEVKSFIEESLNFERQFIAQEANLQAKVAETGEIRNKFAQQRVKAEDDIAAKNIEIQKNERKLFELIATRGAVSQQNLQARDDEIFATATQIGLDTKLLGILTDRKDLVVELSRLQEAQFNVANQAKVLQFQQQLTKELQKQMGIRKQLADLQISEIERAANQAIEDATASGDIRTIFQNDEQFVLQAQVALQESLLEKRKAANQQEFNLKMSQIDAEEKMAQIKRKQTAAEIALLTEQLKQADATNPEGPQNTGIIAGLEAVSKEFADGGSFQASIATSADLSRELAKNTKEANDNKFEDMAANTRRALQNASAMSEVLDTVGDSFRDSLTQSFDAIFDNLADSSMDLSEKLKDIARNFVRTIRQAITKRFLVDPIMDALDKLINPNKKSPEQLIDEVMQNTIANKGNSGSMTSVLTSGADTMKKKMDESANTIKTKMKEALREQCVSKCADDEVTEVIAGVAGAGMPGEVSEAVRTAGDSSSRPPLGSVIDGVAVRGDDGVNISNPDGGAIEEVKVVGKNVKGFKAATSNFIGSLGDIFDKNAEGGFIEKLGIAFEAGGGVFSSIFGSLTDSLSSLFSGLFGGEGGLGSMLSGLFGGGGGDGGLGSLISTGMSFFGFAQGGYTSMMKDYANGGVAKGPRSGYPAILHGNEAVVPLPGGNKIPVEMTGASSAGIVNSSVNININNATGAAEVSTESDTQDAKEFSRQISTVVQAEIRRQQRAGGFLSPHRAN